MQTIDFTDLVKIFGMAQGTPVVQRHVSKEYRDLCKEDPRSDETAKHIGMLKNDPNIFVMAMQLDDTQWNVAHPRRVSLDVDGAPVDTGPLKDNDGQYKVECPMGTFEMLKGDYVYLTADEWSNLDNLQVMDKTQFNKIYFKSENVSHWT